MRRARIVNQALTRIADYQRLESGMQRLRLKADGRIVELRDGQEFPLAPEAVAAPAAISATPADAATAPAVRDLRRRERKLLPVAQFDDPSVRFQPQAHVRPHGRHHRPCALRPD